MYNLTSFFKKKQPQVLIFCISIVFLCCKASQSLAPTDTDVTAAQKHWSGTTMANLSQGYSIYSDKCTTCHGMKKPQDFTVEQWDNVFPPMAVKAHLDSNQYNLVYHYILAKRETVLGAKN